MEAPTSKRALASLFIALAVVAAAVVLANAWKKTHPTGDNAINVTGLATKDFESDLIVWYGAFQQKAPVMKDAYERLKRDAASIKSYLIGKGVKESEIVFSSVNIERKFTIVRNEKGAEIRRDFEGYELSQRVKIESHEVDKTEAVSREITELIDQGVEFYSQEPQYFYTKLADLKIQMLAAATADARTRAEKIAENAKSALGPLRNASMGVFQITGQNSVEGYTSGGAYNTDSKMKTASITVRLEFSLE